MNKTTNYQLNQWERTDKVRMEDFNADNAKIDAAIRAVDAKADTKAAQSALNALQAVVNGKGNCKIEVGSYQGDEVLNRVITITTSFRPKAILLVGHFTACAVQGASVISVPYAGRRYESPLTWSGNNVSWTAAYYEQDTCFNNKDTIYYVALG